MQNALFLTIEADPAHDEAAEDACESFAGLVERHSQFVYRVALAVTRNPQDAEDAVQESFLQLYRGGRWTEIKDQRGYLARVARRMAVRRRKPRTEEQEIDLQIAATGASPEESAMGREQEGWLHTAIDQLPEKLRQPLALAALWELKLVEVAAILGLPEGTVRRRIHTARQMLKRQLGERKAGNHETGK